jgi:catechol 2,3-dioxygenase-like lactoylglutathione lyase family enzyme
METSNITGIYTIGIRVTDQEQALRFYTELLGFETRQNRPLGNGGRWIEVAPAGAPVSIALLPATQAAPAGVETGIRLTALDAAAEHARLRGHNVAVDEVLRWPGVPAMFAFRDADGNGLEIIEMPPVAA